MQIGREGLQRRTDVKEILTGLRRGETLRQGGGEVGRFRPEEGEAGFEIGRRLRQEVAAAAAAFVVVVGAASTMALALALASAACVSSIDMSRSTSVAVGAGSGRRS